MRILFILILASALASDSAPAQTAQLPNIVVILTDDQGWADIGYNNSHVYSPNLDRLASEGATFTQHYVMPQCTPTRVALMTGRYPSRFGPHAQQANNVQAFPRGTLTIASLLKRAGYETCLSGKWHLGASSEDGPNHYGFDESYGSFAGAVGMYDHRYRPGEYFETWHRNHRLIPGSENGTHATDLVTREAVKQIEKQRDAPLFLYVPFQSVHTPLDERGSFTNQPTALDPNCPGRWRNEDQIEWFNDPEGRIQQESDHEKRLFLAAVYHLDHAVGQIVDALERTGQREETLILFSSDNGPQDSWPGGAYPDDLKLTHFNQPLPVRGTKTDVWEGGIHVPGFANWPGKIKPKQIDQQAHIVDWLPTLAHLAGVTDLPDNLDGVDLLPALLRGQQVPQRELYWTWNQKTNRWALRHGDWKIVRYSRQEPHAPEDWQLYNLAADPKETEDLAGAEPELLAQMHQRFIAQRAKDKK